MSFRMQTKHWDAAYIAIAKHPVLRKNTRCAVWIETIGEAVLAATPAPCVSAEDVAVVSRAIILIDNIAGLAEGDKVHAAWHRIKQQHEAKP